MKNKKTLWVYTFALTFSLCIYTSATAQFFGAWKFGGYGSATANAITPTIDGGYVIVGSTDSLHDGNLDFLVLKFDSLLNLQWKRKIGGPNTDRAVSVTQSNDGGIVVAGNSSSYSPVPYYNQDIYIIKLSQNGNILWTKSINVVDFQNSQEYCYSMRKTFDGGYLLGGLVAYLAPTYYENEGFVAKIDDSGNILWSGTLGEDWTKWDVITSITPTFDEGFAIAGYASATETPYDVYLVKMSDTNTVQWGKTTTAIMGSAPDYYCYQAKDMIQTKDGGYAIAGTGNPDFSNCYFGTEQILIAKYDSMGVAQWIKILEPNQPTDTVINSRAYSVIQTRDGGYAITGDIKINDIFEDLDMMLMRFDSSGNLLWSKKIGDYNLDETGKMLVETTDGGFVIAGATSPNLNDVYIVKTDANGNICQNAVSFGTMVSLNSNFKNAGIYSPKTTETNSGGRIDSMGVLTNICSSSNSLNLNIYGYLLCHGICNGTVYAITTGGQAPFNYSWSPSGETTQGLGDICSGNYSVTITDDLGSTSSTSLYLKPIDSLTFMVTTTNATCSGTYDGSSTVIVTSGTPGYYYYWPYSGNSMASDSGYTIGSFSVSVSDSLGCWLETTFEIGESDPLIVSTMSTPATCDICDDGSILVNTSGGTPPYFYYFSPSVCDSSLCSNLYPDTYTIFITDNFGCSVTDTTVVDFISRALPNEKINFFLKIIPNPFSDFTTIEIPVSLNLKEERVNFFIFNLFGEKIQQYPIENHTLRIDQREIKTGLYYYTLASNTEIYFSGKIIKE